MENFGGTVFGNTAIEEPPVPAKEETFSNAEKIKINEILSQVKIQEGKLDEILDNAGERKNFLPVEKVDISLKINLISKVYEKNPNGEFGKYLKNLSIAYTNLKESLNDAALGLNIGQFKDAQRKLREKNIERLKSLGIN